MKFSHLLNEMIFTEMFILYAMITHVYISFYLWKGTTGFLGLYGYDKRFYSQIRFYS